jgi:hypothetical protein
LQAAQTQLTVGLIKALGGAWNDSVNDNVNDSVNDSVNDRKRSNSSNSING